MDSNYPDFLRLKSLADLPEAAVEFRESQAIGVLLNETEAALSTAIERHGTLATRLSATASANPVTGRRDAGAIDPAVDAAGAKVEELRTRRAELTQEAQAARARLAVATERARVAYRADILEDLELKLDRYTEGIQAALAVERLLGPTGLYIDVQGELHRQLEYLLVLSDLLGRA